MTEFFLMKIFFPVGSECLQEYLRLGKEGKTFNILTQVN